MEFGVFQQAAAVFPHPPPPDPIAPDHPIPLTPEHAQCLRPTRRRPEDFAPTGCAVLQPTARKTAFVTALARV